MRRVTAFLLAGCLLAVSFGCGGGTEMGLSEYLEAVSELHDGVAWDLGALLGEMGGLDPRDYYDLPDLQELFRQAAEVFDAAWQKADAMYPPPEAVPLHLDLMDFYARGVRDMSDAENTIGFFEAALPMLADVENIALPGLPENAGVPEIKAAAAEDSKTMSGYCRELRGMEPPDDLLAFRERLWGYLHSIDDAAATVDREIKPEDMGPYQRFREWFAGAVAEAPALREEALGILSGLSARIDVFIAEGKELAERVQEL
ncbi:MAG: hypothetical protein H5T74_10205 [Actinobacteria bacterium]|nr:hypothetical protein [Actinomycetota bacterium]MDI6830460.1 hypothetical protein [Actinomycetota bacterium]